MVRAPCCEKMGLKKGPWSTKEDEILASYIKRYGHGNWRALPKQAGLLRCGKSCRLRWLNYLRPDIKRGNFSIEEDETIVKLHKMIGNRWSFIAAKLPGRTDNEIKNYWRFHLKKRILQQNVTIPTSRDTKSCTRKLEGIAIRSHQMAGSFTTNHGSYYNSSLVPILPQEYSSQEVPNSMTKIDAINNLHNMKDDMKFWYDLLVKAERSRDA